MGAKAKAKAAKAKAKGAAVAAKAKAKAPAAKAAAKAAAKPAAKAAPKPAAKPVKKKKDAAEAAVDPIFIKALGEVKDLKSEAKSVRKDWRHAEKKANKLTYKKHIAAIDLLF